MRPRPRYGLMSRRVRPATARGGGVVRRIAQAEHVRPRHAGHQLEDTEFRGIVGEHLAPNLGLPHLPDALGYRQMGDLVVRGRARERVLTALQPEQQADGPGCHHRPHRDAPLDLPVGKAQKLPPHLRVGICLRHGEHGRPSRALQGSGDHLVLGENIRIPHFGDDLEHAAAGVLKPLQQTGDLSLTRFQRRGVVAVDGAVSRRP